MKKKLIIGTIGVVFMFLAISILATANIQTENTKKESPLYGIRVKNIELDALKSRFIGKQRIFLVAFPEYDGGNLLSIRQRIPLKWTVGGTRCSLDMPCTIFTMCIMCWNQ